VTFCFQKESKAEFYGKSLTLKDCTESGISLPYIQMLAQLLWRLVTNLAENFFRRKKTITHF